jgi:choline kinase
MKVIILAAGEGIRLKPLTNDNPKCLVELFGKSILQWQLDVFNYFKINDISVVKGYLQDQINLSNINYFQNSNYNQTNMVETLFCAREKLFGNVIISYGDIIFEKNVFKKLSESEDDISLIIDKNWEKYWKLRFDNPLDDAESLTIDHNGYITDIGQKTNQLKMIQGQYIGLMKFQNDGLKFLKNFYDDAKKMATKSKNPLNPNLPFEKSFMTDLLRAMINEGYKIKSIPISNGWLELDTYDDFIKYERMYKEKTLSKFFNVKN